MQAQVGGIKTAAKARGGKSAGAKATRASVTKCFANLLTFSQMGACELIQDQELNQQTGQPKFTEIYITKPLNERQLA